MHTVRAKVPLPWFWCALSELSIARSKSCEQPKCWKEVRTHRAPARRTLGSGRGSEGAAWPPGKAGRYLVNGQDHSLFIWVWRETYFFSPCFDSEQWLAFGKLFGFCKGEEKSRCVACRHVGLSCMQDIAPQPGAVQGQKGCFET